MKGHDLNESDWGGIRGNEEGRLALLPHLGCLGLSEIRTQQDGDYQHTGEEEKF
jgi:hypothetical protein